MTVSCGFTWVLDGTALASQSRTFSGAGLEEDPPGHLQPVQYAVAVGRRGAEVIAPPARTRPGTVCR